MALLTNQFDAFFKPRNASDANDTNNTPPTWKTYVFSRHLRRLTLNFGDNANRSHSNRCQPLTTVKNEPRNLVWRVRGYKATNEYRHSFAGRKHNKGYFFVIYLVVQKDWGQCKLPSNIGCRVVPTLVRETSRFPQGVVPTALLFERSEFLIATCRKKKTDRLCVRMFG